MLGIGKMHVVRFRALTVWALERCVGVHMANFVKALCVPVGKAHKASDNRSELIGTLAAMSACVRLPRASTLASSCASGRSPGASTFELIGTLANLSACIRLPRAGTLAGSCASGRLPSASTLIRAERPVEDTEI